MVILENRWSIMYEKKNIFKIFFNVYKFRSRSGLIYMVYLKVSNMDRLRIFFPLLCVPIEYITYLNYPQKVS